MTALTLRSGWKRGVVPGHPSGTSCEGTWLGAVATGTRCTVNALVTRLAHLRHLVAGREHHFKRKVTTYGGSRSTGQGCWWRVMFWAVAVSAERAGAEIVETRTHMPCLSYECLP